MIGTAADVTEVLAVYGDAKANAYLQAGWVVISASIIQYATEYYSNGSPKHAEFRPVYQLGKPRGAEPMQSLVQPLEPVTRAFNFERGAARPVPAVVVAPAPEVAAPAPEPAPAEASAPEVGRRVVPRVTSKGMASAPAESPNMGSIAPEDSIGLDPAAVVAAMAQAARR